MELQNIQLPAGVSENYILKKEVQIVAIRGYGEVDFTKITPDQAKSIIAKTGNKYLEEKSINKKAETPKP